MQRAPRRSSRATPPRRRPARRRRRHSTRIGAAPPPGSSACSASSAARPWCSASSAATPSRFAPTRPSTMPRDLEVLPSADRARQGRVGDVANERVLERELALAGERGSTADGGEQSLSTSAASGRSTPTPPSELADGLLPEALTDDRGGLQQPPLVGVERVEAGRQHRVDAVGQLPDAGALLLAKPVDHLLGEQRVAAGPVRDLLGELASPGPAGQQRPDELLGLVARQRVERDRRRVPPAATPGRPALEQLVASQADDQHRAPPPAGQVLDQVEHALVGPVDVLDRDHDRRRSSLSSSQDQAHRGEDPIADLLGIDVVEVLAAAVDSRAPERSARRCGRRRRLHPPAASPSMPGDELARRPPRGGSAREIPNRSRRISPSAA